MNKEKTIEQRIAEKRNKLIDIHGSLAIYMMQEILPSKRAKAVELQDRLDFRVKDAEEKLLDEKIAIYQQLLDLLKK